MSDARYAPQFSLYRIVLCENLHALFELGILMVLDKRGADAETLLMTACGDEADGRHTIVHQLARQLPAGHARIANGEVETVGNGFVEVFVIYDVESMAGKNLLQPFCAAAVFTYVFPEIIYTVACGFQHGGKGILGTVARS